MRFSPSACTLAAAFAVLLLPAALPAQATGSAPAAARPAGCRGTNTQTSSIAVPLGKEAIDFPSYPVIERVQPGSPAERAGMRPQDIIVLQNGHDVVGSPPTQPVLAGDTVVFTVRRGDVEVPLTVVLGRWDPAEDTPGVTRVCRPLASNP